MSEADLHDAIAVVDFGGQYAHLIATKVRAQNVLAEILQPEDSTDIFRKYKGIILSGSPALSSQGEDSAYNKDIFDLSVPILGFCFGHQEIAKRYGGTVENSKQEWGKADLHIQREHPLFTGCGTVEQVWMSHNDTVTSVGPEFEELGYTRLGDESEPHHFAAIGSDSLKRYGFQFHPEVDDSINGEKMIRNFVIDICECAPSWTMERYVEEELARIREQVGERSVFLLASGGVDSTVAARMFQKALAPEQLKLLHVDNGLMRKDESKNVIEAFGGMGLGDCLEFVDATEDFLTSLDGLVEPEEKRRAIGDTFVAVFEREARRLGLESSLLGQGTIYPDTIETGGTKRADTIKTHHNRVPVIEEMIAQGKVIEPLAELYKTEVRQLAEELEIPAPMIWRQPFPGPGLGVRLLCSDGTDMDATELSALSESVQEHARAFSLDAQALPIKSVGVKADLRSYEHPVLLHGDVAWETLLEASGKILKSVKGINRCVVNLLPELPKAIHPRKAYMTKDRLDALREADHIVMEGLRRYDLERSVWQCPTVFVPVSVDGQDGEMCVVRPIHSERAMTASAAKLPSALLQEISEQLAALPSVVSVTYDITSKPPGTIEWE